MTTPLTIEFKTKDANKYTPKKAFANDAGWDVFACLDKPVKLMPGQFKAISTGISVAIPEGYCIVLKERSGLALKNGIRIGGGVIDCQYRGEIKAIVHNLYEDTDQPFEITNGMKIAQMLILPVPQVIFVPVGTLSETNRGAGGFGSTGV